MVPPAPPSRQPPRLVLVHDYLLVMRGAERVFAAMADMYPQAPIFTLLYDEQGTGGRFAEHQITVSAVQRLRVSQRSFRRLLPLYPFAVERLRLPACDVVLSSSSAFAHGVHLPPGALQICYCHAPFRYAWYEQDRALGEVPAVLGPLLRAQLAWTRRWDLAASAKVDSYIANSELTRERIWRFYGREAKIIHPPVETERFRPGTPGESLLVVSELVTHKRVHVAIEAARLAGAPITVVGAGPDHRALAEAYPEARFVGRVSDEELVELYASARAVIVPGIEEFGITAVEAQASGRPVIAARGGGALETVLDGTTGRLARLDDVDSFARAIAEIDTLSFDPEQAVRQALRFSVAEFRRRLIEHVEGVLAGRTERGS